MPNDAKLGLFLGISLVVVIGLVFFRAETGAHGKSPAPVTNINSVQDSSSQDTPRQTPAD